MRGRLQYQIEYEDVITFLDGVKRYRSLVDQPQEHLQYFYQYVIDPLQAPLHSLQAGVAFALLGIHDWAPYVSNGGLLFFTLFSFCLCHEEIGSCAYPIPGATVALLQQWVKGELAETWQEMGCVEDPAGKKTMVLQRIIQ